jgi:hypothetical protein
MRTMTLSLGFVGVLLWGALANAQVKGGEILERDQIAKMSPSDISSKAESYLKDMEQALDSVSKMLKEAQDSKDFQRFQCVNGVLTMMKSVVKMAQETKVDLGQAIRANDRASVEHQFIKISIAWGKVVELEARAKACGGPGLEAIFEGKTIREKEEEGVPMDNVKAGVVETGISGGMLMPPPSGIPEGMQPLASPFE